ncbi:MULTISPECIES: hypothetical protein [unclassified Acinetobacter]|uniref:hypothetical protein n=1 Tax=unclassified Acinetobacter TaxID=196816 RepID=UPI0015D42EAE|nr:MULTISPECIES: hypothetical protein [unclassified Acinetobacter]QOW50423.1 hypothetical protein G0029_11895 [Acinetobacter sp. YH12138]
MGNWNKRLRDCAIHLENAISNYLEPDLFRINFNNFMQTARTVTFLIQKEKNELQKKFDFDIWYQDYQSQWRSDSIMRWSIDTRNIIEKQSDIPMYSKIEIKLAIGYLSQEDIELDIDQEELVFLGIKQLVGWAKKNLSHYNDGAIWVGRSWKDPQLEKIDLVTAMQYVYSRLYECCMDLNGKVGHSFQLKTPDKIISDFNITYTFEYIDLNTFNTLSFKKKTYPSDGKVDTAKFLEERPFRNGRLSEELKLNFLDLKRRSNSIKNKQELLEVYTETALLNFKCDGSILHVALFFDEKFNCIKFLPYLLPNQVSKYIFWRNLGVLVSILKPKYLIFSDEYYVREKPLASQYWRHTNIIGEYLSTRLLTKLEENQFELSEIRYWIKNEQLTQPPIKENSSYLMDIQANNEAFMYVPILKEL